MRSVRAIALVILLAGCGGEDIVRGPLVTRIDEHGGTWSPDGDRIAYTNSSTDPTNTAYRSGLYVTDTLGIRTLLVAGTISDPDWSADGEWLAFTGPDARLWAIRPDGTGLHSITSFPAFRPSWSPDGTRLAIETPHQDPAGRRALWLVASDGSWARDLSVHGTGEWRDPDWSPAGDEIVHLRQLIGVTGLEVVVMDTSGTGERRLTHNSFSDSDPEWSPTGEWIAWTSVRDDPQIWLMRPDGSDSHALIVGQEPAWSPDGSELLFSRRSADGTRVRLHAIGRDGSRLRQITH